MFLNYVNSLHVTYLKRTKIRIRKKATKTHSYYEKPKTPLNNVNNNNVHNILAEFRNYDMTIFQQILHFLHLRFLVISYGNITRILEKMANRFAKIPPNHQIFRWFLRSAPESSCSHTRKNMRKKKTEVFYRFHLTKHILALYLLTNKVVIVWSLYNGADYKIIHADYELSHVSFLLIYFHLKALRMTSLAPYTFREATMLRLQWKL